MSEDHELEDLKGGKGLVHKSHSNSEDESSHLVEAEEADDVGSGDARGLSFGAKLYRTGCACAAYFSVTLSLGILGPSLVDFEVVTGASTSQVSMVFLCRGILAIFGSLILGPVLDRLDHYVIVGSALLFDFVLHGAVPWCQSLGPLLATLSPPEFFNCAIGMGTHLICLDVWGDKAGPSLQLLNLISVFGFMGAPLMVSPFLADNGFNHGNGSHGCREQALLDYNLTQMNKSLSAPEQDVVDRNHFDVELDHLVMLNETSAEVPASTKVHYAYVVVALYSLLVAGFVMLVVLLDGSDLLRRRSQADITGPERKQNPRMFVIKVSLLFFVFNVFYGGLEVGYAGLVMSYAVHYLGWDKGTGAYVTAVLQGSNAIVTAAAIVFSKYIRPHVILIYDVTIVVLSLLLLAVMADSYPIILWVSTAMLGAGYATVMPSSFTWAQSFMEVTGNFSGIYWCGYFTGFMAVPALAGFLFDKVHNMWFVYVMLGCGVGMTLALGALYLVVNKRTTHTDTEPPPTPV